MLTVNGSRGASRCASTRRPGGIDRFFDLVEDPAQVHDLAGGAPAWNSYPTLFLDRLWYDAFSGPSRYGWSAGDSQTPDSRVELLERRRRGSQARQEAFYHHASIQGQTARVPAMKGLGDYSVYGVGRLALEWQRRAFGPVTWGGGGAAPGAAELTGSSTATPRCRR